MKETKLCEREEMKRKKRAGLREEHRSRYGASLIKIVTI